MEVENLIEQFIEQEKIQKVKKEITENATFLDLTTNADNDSFTVQYNKKGIISVYYRNSQFYDEPDTTLISVINAIIERKMIAREDKKGLVYYCAALENNQFIEPTRYTE